MKVKSVALATFLLLNCSPAQSIERKDPAIRPTVRIPATGGPIEQGVVFFQPNDNCIETEFAVRISKGKASLVMKPPFQAFARDQISGRIDSSEMTFLFGRDGCRISLQMKRAN